MLAPAAISKNPRRVDLSPAGLSNDDKSDVGMMCLAFPKKIMSRTRLFPSNGRPPEKSGSQMVANPEVGAS
jgi:hypothetical protein